MNLQLRPDKFRRDTQVPPRELSLAPDLIDQVVAGLLWISLDLPEDVSRREMEMMAHRLVTRIKAGMPDSELEQEVAFLQLRQFSRTPNHAAIRGLIRRAVNAVNGF